MITEAIILAGGMGTRLRTEVPDLPKCMAPVNNVPFIAFVISYLQQQGINHFIFSLGYKSESIVSYLDENYDHLHKTYSVEEEPLGTGGAIKLALHKATTDNVLVVNGDTLFKADVKILAAVHKEKNAECTLALKQVADNVRYGCVVVDSSQRVNSFIEKNKTEAAGYVNGGMYILNKGKYIEAISGSTFSFEKDYAETFVDKHFVAAAIFDDYFIDIGTPEDYRRFMHEATNI